MGYKAVGQYGIIGNQVTSALVGDDGAVDWLCLPYQDSPSVFAALLDEAQGGRFAITPTAPWDAVQRYLPRTNILQLGFRTAAGEVELLDLMPRGEGVAADPANRGRLLRRVRGLAGAVELRIVCRPRFDYARVRPVWQRAGDGRVRIDGGGEHLDLECDHPLAWDAETAVLTVAADETVWLTLTYGRGDAPPAPLPDPERLLAETRAFWEGWLERGRVGKYPTRGFWQDQLDRSALLLKLLQFEDTGAIAAAPTTSLPAIVHGSRNWDYRFSWLRDTSMTLNALAELGHSDEMGAYLRWIEAVAGGSGTATPSIIYRLSAPETPGGERTLDHLSGYKGSRPVRVGQFVVEQRQHDVYGEVLDTLFTASRFIGKIDPENWRALRPLVDTACRVWRERDHGIWEMRGPPQHFTHSKLMCWVALDRGVKIAEHYGLEAPLEQWRGEREAVREDILEHGFNRDRGCFTQHYATGAVDAALLLIPLMGFLPVDDPRVAGTVRRVEEELWCDGVLLRYRADDGLPGQEHGFLICLFWYLDCLVQAGRLDEVEEHLRAVDHYANPLGLLGEQYDPVYRQITGNYPQAYSHIGFATTVLRYLDARFPPASPRPPSWRARLWLLVRPLVLNPAPPGTEPAADGNPVERVRRTMNTLRGLFYDGHHQRVDYARIRGAPYYGVFREAVAALSSFDPDTLATDAERVAFWTNLFNVIVIHGVVELGVTGSVRQVPGFFSRIGYRIGGAWFTPDTIEHGILRGNSRPPHGSRRPFGRRDPRRRLAVRRVDPRIHFALVCASRTCPPVEVYEAGRIDRQLATSAQVFINGTSRYDAARNRLHLSKVFRWYWNDFGRDRPALVRWVADHLYQRETAEALYAAADRVRLVFDPYDWRLNR